MKRLLYFLGFGLILLTIGGCSMYRGQTEETAQEEMMRVVRSTEVTGIVEEELTSLDSNALKESGVIKNYEIDADTVKHNPMGGINFKVMINKNPDLYVLFTIDKNTNNGKLEYIGGGYSSELSKLLKGG